MSSSKILKKKKKNARQSHNIKENFYLTHPEADLNRIRTLSSVLYQIRNIQVIEYKEARVKESGRQKRVSAKSNFKDKAVDIVKKKKKICLNIGYSCK